MKRILDLLIMIVVFTIIIPFMIPIIIILLLTGEHYVFYLQERIGLHGKTFKIIKFATMMKNSSKIGTGEITLKKDPRVFPFGTFLRKSKLNEIPQLLNVLFGQMSIVGPRPLTKKHFNYYTPETQEIIGKNKPGLTGIASIVFRDEEALFDLSGMDHENFYKTFLSPKKGELERWYHENKSMVTDIKLMFCTAVVILNSESDIVYKLFSNLPRVLES